MTPLTLAPPPGPLCWVFPELLAVAGGSHGAVLLAGAHALRDDAATCVRVQPGPLGHALAAILREHARDPWQQVPGVDWHPAPGSLEGAIARAAAMGEATVELSCRQAGVCAAAAPLTPQHAERRLVQRTPAPWVLPVAADARAVAALAGAQRVIDAAPGLFAAAGLVPVVVHDIDGDAATPRPTRAALSSWGIVAPDAADEVRAGLQSLVAALYPERALLHLGHDSVARAGGDLYSDALRDTLAAAPMPAPRARAMIVAVCGIDGAGKSSHVRALAEHLAASGLRVKTHKIYRHGVFHDTVTDVTRRCAGDHNLHLWRVERLAKAFDSVKYFFSDVAPDLAAYDVLLFDRYTPTHFAAGAGRCHFDPFTRELLAVYPAADRVFLLDAPVESALARLAERSARTVDENPYMLGRYHALLRRLASAENMVVLDACAPFAVNQARIRSEVTALWRARQAR